MVLILSSVLLYSYIGVVLLHHGGCFCRLEIHCFDFLPKYMRSDMEYGSNSVSHVKTIIANIMACR